MAIKEALAVLSVACSTLIASSPLPAGPAETVLNGSFEDAGGSDRPRYWYIGFPGESLPPGAGSWELDDEAASDGTHSLKLEDYSGDGYFVSQMLNGNSNFLAGVTVTASVDVMVEEGAQAQLTVLAYNPELEPDPEYGIGIAGELSVSSGGTGGAFHAIGDSFVAADRALGVVAILTAVGGGTVWFDNVSVRWEQPPTQPMPEVPDVTPAFDVRDFGWGWVNENPANYSERAFEQLTEKLAEYGGDVLNLFCHVRYNQLAGLPLLDGFDQELALSSLAKGLGLNRVLTFDFTHNSLDGIGYLNPMPDGTSPGPFEDADVRDAMKAEILALAEAIEPIAVFVGVEINFFYEKNPGSWDAYVQWYGEVRHALKAAHPDVAVSIYVTLPSLLDASGEFTPEGLDIFNSLSGELDVLAYSTYRFSDDLDEGRITQGMFSKVGGLDPQLPIALPEFGVTTKPLTGKDERENQLNQVEVLQYILNEIVPHGCAFACLYSLYDQTYLGSPQWFKKAFGNIGLHDLSYSPKLSAAWFERIAQMAPDDDTDDDDDSSDDDSDDDTDDGSGDGGEGGCGC